MDSFYKYLDFSLQNISSGIISSENKKVLLKLGSVLPDTFAHFVFGYEKRLSDTDAKADIAISALNNLKSQYNFSSIFNYPPIAEIISSSPEWQRLKSFSKAWSEPDSEIHRLLEGISVEFDFESLLEDNFVPSVFLGMESMRFLRNPENKNQLFERLGVFISGIEILSGNSANPETGQYLTGLGEKLFNKFSVFQTGVMLSRKETPIRICLKRFEYDQLPEILDKVIQKKDRIAELREIMTKYGKYFDHFVLALDLAGSEIVKTGIECYYSDKIQPSKERRWHDVLELLTDNGDCTRSMTDEILRFPGKFMWKGKKEFEGSENIPNFYAQGLHHLKFTAGADKNTFAKIYLWSGYNWN